NSFEVLKLLENSVEVLKIQKNKLELMKIPKNKLESLKLQENRPVDGLVSLSIKKFTSECVLPRLLKNAELCDSRVPISNPDLLRYHTVDAELCDSRVPISNPDLLRYHTVGGVLLRDEDRRLYEDMTRLQGLGTYTDDQIMAWFAGASSAGTFTVSVGFWREGARTSLMSSCLDAIILPMCMSTKELQSRHESGSGSGCGAGEDDGSGDDEDAGEDADI
nr:hypothetical protein [Tanacetum cinerariifolium]